MASPSSIRDVFIQAFGEEDAERIERAAELHAASGWIDDYGRERGSDPFRWALCICIGFECMSEPAYRTHHGITTPWADLAMWILDHADLASHDGGVDRLAALAGAYEGLV